MDRASQEARRIYKVSGDPGDLARVLRAEVRSGRLEPWRVEAASLGGCVPARLALGVCSCGCGWEYGTATAAGPLTPNLDHGDIISEHDWCERLHVWDQHLPFEGRLVVEVGERVSRLFAPSQAHLWVEECPVCLGDGGGESRGCPSCLGLGSLPLTIPLMALDDVRAWIDSGGATPFAIEPYLDYWRGEWDWWWQIVNMPLWKTPYMFKRLFSAFESMRGLVSDFDPLKKAKTELARFCLPGVSD